MVPRSRLILVTCFSCLLFAYSPARADPIVPAPGARGILTFPFSVEITAAYGPLEILFGRPFHIGDTLSGRVTFDGRSSGDIRPGQLQVGEYQIASGRLELDVPSGFVLEASSANWFNAGTYDNFPVFGDELIFFANACCVHPELGVVNVDVLWLDASGRALTGDRLPTDPRILSGFASTQFGMLVDSPFVENRMALFGASESPAPVPEPATLLLFATGAAAIGGRTWKRRMSQRW